MKNKSDFLLKLHSSAPAIFHRELLMPETIPNLIKIHKKNLAGLLR